MNGKLHFLVMVLLSSTVATLGLLTNSAAVIIGAMLLAPLMGPIVAGSLAMTMGDPDLLKRSFRTEIIGGVLAVVVATFITLLSPTREITAEILSRTQPTLLDLLVALASGMAGAWAMVYQRSSALPGVAIATALMPPLCVVGIGLATYQSQVAGGGFLLFLANLIAINLASSLIFRLAGFTSRDGSQGYRKGVAISLLLLVFISIPLGYIMIGILHKAEMEKVIRQALGENVNVVANSELTGFTFAEEGNQVMIQAVIRSPEGFRSETVRQMENLMEYRLKRPVALELRVVPMQLASGKETRIGKGFFESPQPEGGTVPESPPPQQAPEGTQ